MQNNQMKQAHLKLLLMDGIKVIEHKKARN